MKDRHEVMRKKKAMENDFGTRLPNLQLYRARRNCQIFAYLLDEAAEFLQRALPKGVQQRLAGIAQLALEAKPPTGDRQRHFLLHLLQLTRQVLHGITAVGNVALYMCLSGRVEAVVLDRVAKHVESADKPIKGRDQRLDIIRAVATGTIVSVQALAHSDAKRNDANC